jgi:hypothetical protein
MIQRRSERDGGEFTDVAEERAASIFFKYYLKKEAVRFFENSASFCQNTRRSNLIRRRFRSLESHTETFLDTFQFLPEAFAILTVTVAVGTVRTALPIPLQSDSCCHALLHSLSLSLCVFFLRKLLNIWPGPFSGKQFL